MRRFPVTESPPRQQPDGEKSSTEVLPTPPSARTSVKSQILAKNGDKHQSRLESARETTSESSEMQQEAKWEVERPEVRPETVGEDNSVRGLGKRLAEEELVKVGAAPDPPPPTKKSRPCPAREL